MSFLKNLNWRYATKQFDSTKKVSKENLDAILESIRMTPTSFGMQAYKVFVVQDQAKKEAISEVSWNQPQPTDCSDLLVLCARNDIAQAQEEFMQLMSGDDEKIRESLAEYENMMTGFVSAMDETQKTLWSEKQTYIALGFAMAACAELEIDSCPMEGFDPQKVSEILDIPDSHTVSLLLPIGYRSAEDSIRPKVRFSTEKIVSFV